MPHEMFRQFPETFTFFVEKKTKPRSLDFSVVRKASSEEVLFELYSEIMCAGGIQMMMC